jgi:hypothetical protein
VGTQQEVQSLFRLGRKILYMCKKIWTVQENTAYRVMKHEGKRDFPAKQQTINSLSSLGDGSTRNPSENKGGLPSPFYFYFMLLVIWKNTPTQNHLKMQ